MAAPLSQILSSPDSGLGPGRSPSWPSVGEVWEAGLDSSPDTLRGPHLAPELRESSLPLLCPLSTAPAQAQIVHAGQACVVKEDNISERVYTIRESDTLVLQCLVTGHPRPQVSWASALPGSRLPTHCHPGSESERKQEVRIYTPQG